MDYAYSVKTIPGRSTQRWSCVVKSQDERLNGTPAWSEIKTRSFYTRQDATKWGAEEVRILQDYHPCLGYIQAQEEAAYDTYLP